MHPGPGLTRRHSVSQETKAEEESGHPGSNLDVVKTSDRTARTSATQRCVATPIQLGSGIIHSLWPFAPENHQLEIRLLLANIGEGVRPLAPQCLVRLGACPWVGFGTGCQNQWAKFPFLKMAHFFAPPGAEGAGRCATAQPTPNPNENHKNHKNHTAQRRVENALPTR